MPISSRYVSEWSNLRKQNSANDLTAEDSSLPSLPFGSPPHFLPYFPFCVTSVLTRCSRHGLGVLVGEFSLNFVVEYFLVWFCFVWNGHLCCGCIDCTAHFCGSPFCVKTRRWVRTTNWIHFIIVWSHLCVFMYMMFLFLSRSVSRWVKRPGSGIDHPPPSSAEVKERVRSIPLLPLLGFVAFYRVNFTPNFKLNM